MFLTTFTGIVGQTLALSAGVTIYVAASDLIPEVNKERSWGVAPASGPMAPCASLRTGRLPATTPPEALPSWSGATRPSRGEAT